MNRVLLIVVLGITLIILKCYSGYAGQTSPAPSSPGSQQTSSETTAAPQMPKSLQKTPTSVTPEQTASPTSQSSSEFFGWASAPGGFSENWQTGLALFVLGLVGALITVYLFLGEFLPSMGGKAEYEMNRQEIEDLKKRREAAVKKREKLGESLNERKNFGPGEGEVIRTGIRASDSLIRQYNQTLENLRREATGERWRLFLIGFPMYILLGGFFASAFALNLLQALVIGFGWTAVADRIGLQRQLDVKKQATKEEISKVEATSVEEIKQLKEANTKLENQLAAATALAQRATSELVRASQPQARPPTR